MKYYLAPMEGITTYIFRNAYHRCFGGVDKYFTPFLSGQNLSSRERNDVLPEHNQGISLVPQILTNRAEEFLEVSRQLADYGYTSVNLNLGCPSGTVVAKRRGAGFLGVPEELDRFLEEVFDKCSLRISIKTRIGISAMEEWDDLLTIYEKYPLEELIIHPRLQAEGYGGHPHRDAFQKAVESLRVPLCYNGDIFSCTDREGLLTELPTVETIMLGRGILRHPWLPGELKGSPSECNLALLREFHGELLENYRKIMSGDIPTLYKMKDLWTYLSKSFESSERYLKKIQKANRISDYERAVEALFEQCRYIGAQTQQATAEK